MIEAKINIPKWFNNIDFEEPIKKAWLIYTNKLRNQIISNAPFKSWKLRRSFKNINFNTQNWFSTEIWSNLPYARIQDTWWTIKPNKWDYLTFKVWWKWVRTKKSKIKWNKYFTRAREKWDNEKLNQILEEQLKIYLNKIA